MQIERILLASHYLPCLDYWAIWLYAEKHQKRVFIETKEHYIKQTYRNRCRILLTNRQIDLVVPILHTGSAQPLEEVRLCYKQKWPQQHWQSIRSAYGKTPFFEHYSPLFQEVLFQKHERLLSLNEAMRQVCCQILGLGSACEPTAFYEAAPAYTHDARASLSPKKEALFEHEPYLQAFGAGFSNNLSILDLIFAEGKNGTNFLAELG